MFNTTFKEIQRRVMQRVQNDDTNLSDTYNDLVPKLKNWINERYFRIMRSKPWDDLIKKTTLQIVAEQKAYALPRDIGQIISVFDVTNGIPIKQIPVKRHVRNFAPSLDVDDNEQSGDPTRFYFTGKYNVKALTGTTAEKVSIVSSSASDVSPLCVHIVGLVSAVEKEEDVVITGATSVDSTNTWDASQKLNITIGTNDDTIPQLNGTVTVTGKTSSNVLTKVSEFELATPYQWIEVSTTPDDDTTQPEWEIWHRQRVKPLVNSNDFPIIPCALELVQGAYSDALREDGQENDANTADQKFVLMVEELWSSTHNPDDLQQFVPYSANMGISDGYGRIVVGDYYA